MKHNDDNPPTPKVYQFQPRHDANLVQALIGCMLKEQHAAVANLAAWFRAEYISDYHARQVYTALMKIHENKLPLTAETLLIAIRWTKKSEESVLMHWAVEAMFYSTSFWWHMPYFAKEVYEDWRRLHVADDVQETAQDIASGRLEVDAAWESLGSLKNRYAPPPSSREQDNRQVLAEIEQDLDGRARQERRITGIVDLDRITGGFAPGSVVVIGARPSQGKSALCTQIVACNLNWYACAMYSLEMSNKEVYCRLASQFSRRDRNHPEFRDALKGLADRPLFLSCGPIRISALERSAREWISHIDKAAGVICVDYLQLVEPDAERKRREEAVSDISRRLKVLAMETGCPVIVASQLNRGTEEGGAPKMHHLRESGAIEQDADYVILLHPESKTDSETKVAVAVAKNRHGATGVANLVWRKPIHRFSSGEEVSHETRPW